MLHLENLVPCTINFQMFIENRTFKKIRLKESFLSAMLHNILEVICDFYPKACWGGGGVGELFQNLYHSKVIL